MFGGFFWVEGAEGTGNFIVCDEMVILLKSFIYCTFNQFCFYGDKLNSVLQFVQKKKIALV